MDRTIFLLVAYDGTEFHGWQKQPEMRTVQDLIEQAVRRVVRHQVVVHGSGRTDAGVHAVGHVSHFVTTCPLPCDKLKHAIGSRIPKDVSLIEVREVHPDFHARGSAVCKLYRYRIHNAAHRPVELRTQRYAYHFWHALDIERMRAAAGYFLGEQDFAAMAAKDCAAESTVRKVLRCDVERHFDEVRMDVEGTGFLYKQVRTMAGTLVEVGRGQWEPECVAEILTSKDRTKAGPSLPARGLCLEWVKYPAALLAPPAAVARAAGNYQLQMTNDER